MGLGTSGCPVFKDMFDYASWACGAALTGAELILSGETDIFVLQTGMDALAGDPLAHLELTNNAHAEIIGRLLGFNKPLLATGGGGYHVDNTVRGWALVAWKIMCDL